MPYAPPLNLYSNRCAVCGQSLRRTVLTGKPERQDHAQGCLNFGKALKVMRYVDGLVQAGSELKGPVKSRQDRIQREYLAKGAKELTAAACADDVVLALGKLRDRYAAERGLERAAAQIIEMLKQACEALVKGSDPAPIVRVPG